MTEKKIDYLTEDDPIYGQHWVCMSFLSPEGIKNCKIRGIKIRGIYDTKDEADARAKYLQQIDPDFSTFVGEVGKWLPINPDPNDVPDQVYAEEQLNDLMKAYKKNLEKGEIAEKQRKNEMLKNVKVRNSKEDDKDKSIERMRKRLEDKKLEENKSESIDIHKEIEKKETENKTIDENIKKISELYRMMINKETK